MKMEVVYGVEWWNMKAKYEVVVFRGSCQILVAMNHVSESFFATTSKMFHQRNIIRVECENIFIMQLWYCKKLESLGGDRGIFNKTYVV
jgi:hypothetical protein